MNKKIVNKSYFEKIDKNIINNIFNSPTSPRLQRGLEHLQSNNVIIL